MKSNQRTRVLDTAIILSGRGGGCAHQREETRWLRLERVIPATVGMQ
jgi:hypothetical protein